METHGNSGPGIESKWQLQQHQIPNPLHYRGNSRTIFGKLHRSLNLKQLQDSDESHWGKILQLRVPVMAQQK